MAELKVAIVHDYLNEYGGAERVLESIKSVFPDAPVYTSMFRQENFPKYFQEWDIKTSKAQNLPFLTALSKHYTFLYPASFEAFDLREYNVVISSSASWAKGVLTDPTQLHVCYCHTPPRFLYHYSGESAKREAWYYKPFVAYIDNYLRIWDYQAAQRPDYFVANSQNVARRIKKFYGRDSVVIYPPVKTHKELILPTEAQQFDRDYYLVVSRLAAYKNIDKVIEAFNMTGYALRIAGTGKEESKLKKMIHGNIAVIGKVDERELAVLYQNCKGVVNAVEDEDFGIVPIEAFVYGKPVLAHKSGGHLETVEDGKTGMLFDDASPKSLAESVKMFDDLINANRFDQAYIKQHVQKFDENIFKTALKDFVLQKVAEKNIRI